MSLTGFKNISQILTLEGALRKDGRHLKPVDLGLIDDGAIVFDQDKIHWVGRNQDIPDQYRDISFVDRKGFCLTPGLVDAHTHLVFAGDRAHEYAERLNGVTYQEIAARGGGILYTVKCTNEASRADLFKEAINRIERIYSYGVKAIEIKSGYGLNFEKEKELSLIIQDLKKHFAGKMRIHNTYMAAHDIPNTFKSSKDYLDLVVLPLLEELAPLKIIDSVDIFFEQKYFDHLDTERLFLCAKKLNIPTRLHADEFNDNKGAVLGVKHGSLSVDHLLATTEDGFQALANSKTIATILPGTGLFLGKKQAKAKIMLEAGVKLAIASDYNPGSCHFDNVLKLASMVAPNLQINQAALWSAITLNAAHALGFNDQGAIVQGLKPIFTFFKSDSIDKITYNWSENLFEF
jgi:imidazolonepropionase